MGQYFYIINLDKKQHLHPHRFGEGLKLLEYTGSEGPGCLTALNLLLCSMRYEEYPLVGSWEGNRISVVGDYADNHEGQSAHNDTGEYTDISAECKSQFGKLYPHLQFRELV